LVYFVQDYQAVNEVATMKKKTSFKTYIIIPFSLLLLNAIEEVAMYKLNDYLPSDAVHLRVCASIFLFSIALSILAAIVVPYIETILSGTHKVSMSQTGNLIGTIISVLIALGIIYYIYYYIYGLQTPGELLPEEWN